MGREQTTEWVGWWRVGAQGGRQVQWARGQASGVRGQGQGSGVRAGVRARGVRPEIRGQRPGVRGQGQADAGRRLS